eukprot:2862269-Rhodomonas_salina.1
MQCAAVCTAARGYPFDLALPADASESQGGVDGGSLVRYLPTRVLGDVRYWHSVCCYLPSADTAYGPTRTLCKA